MAATAKPDWENLEVVSRNKERGHALAFVCDTARQALARAEAPYRFCLNGQWRFLWIQGSELPEGVTRADTDDSGWDEIAVPGVWQRQGFGTPFYYAISYPQAICTTKNKIPKISRALQEIGVYRRAFEVPESFAGRRVYLHFGAAKAALEVYLNGKKIGYSQGSMTPHEFDVTDDLKKGVNQLTAVVWRYSDGTYLEDQDMWFFSGIYRDVFLYAEPPVQIRDYYLRAEWEDTLERATARLTLMLQNSKGPAAVKVRATIPRLSLELGSAAVTVDGERKLEFAAVVNNPELWSPETPALYDVLLELDSGGEITYKAFRFGFKKTEIRGNALLLNGQPLVIRGINRHDYDPDTGWTLSDARYREDMGLLKRLNINALRTSHYPNDPRLYDLCDEYGILVMDEADFESHGARGKLPVGDPRWTPHGVDRVESMVLRDRNHACVFFWSLGNESGTGENFGIMRRAAEALDRTRPFHYEGEHNRRSSDVISRMYPDEQCFAALCEQREIRQKQGILSQIANGGKAIAAQLYASMPVLLCEYAHCMENSLGNLKEYTDAFEQYPHLCGGFIWDFADQSIRQTAPDGTERWLYGTDFAERHNARNGYKSRLTTGSNGYFCANGIVAADRAPHPAALEVKQCYQPLTVSASGEPGCYLIRNRQLFSTPEKYRLRWTLSIDGAAVAESEIQDTILDGIPPLGERTVAIDLPEIPAGTLAAVTFRWYTREKTPWAEAGYLQAESQIVLQMPGIRTHTATVAEAPGIQQSEGGWTVTGTDFAYRFVGGMLVSAVVGGRERLNSPLKPCYYRAETDNDRGFANFVGLLLPFTNGQRWKRAAERQRPRAVRTARESGAAVMTVEWSVPGCSAAKTEYRVFGDGAVQVAHEIISKKRDLVRCGMELSLPDGYTGAKWLGRGPHENYPDRKTGALFGQYKSGIAELSHHYMRPQENGARCDTFALRLAGTRDAATILDQSGEGFLFTARHYSTDELDAAAHIDELKKRPMTALNIDGAMCGVGGDLPGLLALHQQYRLKANEKHRVAFLLKFEKNGNNKL